SSSTSRLGGSTCSSTTTNSLLVGRRTLQPIPHHSGAGPSSTPSTSCRPIAVQTWTSWWAGAATPCRDTPTDRGSRPNYADSVVRVKTRGPTGADTGIRLHLTSGGGSRVDADGAGAAGRAVGPRAATTRSGCRHRRAVRGLHRRPDRYRGEAELGGPAAGDGQCGTVAVAAPIPVPGHLHHWHQHDVAGDRGHAGQHPSRTTGGDVHVRRAVPAAAPVDRGRRDDPGRLPVDPDPGRRRPQPGHDRYHVRHG